MRSVLRFAIVIIFISNVCFAQGPGQALGMKVGFGGGLTYTRKLSPKYGFEGVATIRWGGPILTGFLKREVDLGSNLAWFYGGGLHLGYHRRDNFIYEDDNSEELFVNVGVDFILGTIYRFSTFPIEVGLDYRPSIDFLTTRNFMPEMVALNLRYRFD